MSKYTYKPSSRNIYQDGAESSKSSTDSTGNEKPKTMKPTIQVDKYLPKTSSEIRSLPIYDVALRAIQWQRDNYLVGQQYAERRQVQRPKSIPLTTAVPIDRIKQQLPYDPTALGHIQLAYLGSWFIPSPTVHQALLPIVTSLPNDSLFLPTLRASTNLIDSMQANMDDIVKSSIIEILKDNEWKEMMKNSTKGYLADNRPQQQHQSQH